MCVCVGVCVCVHVCVCMCVVCGVCVWCVCVSGEGVCVCACVCVWCVCVSCVCGGMCMHCKAFYMYRWVSWSTVLCILYITTHIHTHIHTALSKTLNLNLPYSPPSSSMTLPRTQPMLTSPHHSEIFEIARSKTASAPQKRLNISLDSGDSYVQFTKVPKGYLPSPNESGYSASVDSSGFHRTGFLPLDPIFRHLSSPDEEYSSRGEVASSLSVDSPLSEYHSADDPQTLRSVASYNGTREATGVPVHYGEQRVSNSPESQGLQQDGGGEIVDYVNVQRGSFLILPVVSLLCDYQVMHVIWKLSLFHYFPPPNTHSLPKPTAICIHTAGTSCEAE